MAGCNPDIFHRLRFAFRNLPNDCFKNRVKGDFHGKGVFALSECIRPLFFQIPLKLQIEKITGLLDIFREQNSRFMFLLSKCDNRQIQFPEFLVEILQFHPKRFLHFAIIQLDKSIDKIL